MFPTGTGGYSNSFTPLVSRPSVLSETPSIATNGDLREHYVQSLLREKTVLVQELTQKDRLIHELFQYIKALEAELAARQRIPKPVNVGASSTHHVPLMRTGLDQQATSIGLERPGACILSDTISVSYPEGLVTRSPSPSATQSGLNPIPTPATTPSSTCESVLPQELPPREVLAPVEKGQPTAGDETNKHAPPFLADDVETLEPIWIDDDDTTECLHQVHSNNAKTADEGTHETLKKPNHLLSSTQRPLEPNLVTDDSGDIALEFIVDRILNHRVQDHELFFLTKWLDSSPDDTTWEPLDSFVNPFTQALLDYLLNLDIVARRNVNSHWPSQLKRPRCLTSGKD